MNFTGEKHGKTNPLNCQLYRLARFPRPLSAPSPGTCHDLSAGLHNLFGCNSTMVAGSYTGLQWFALVDTRKWFYVGSVGVLYWFHIGLQWFALVDTVNHIGSERPRKISNDPQFKVAMLIRSPNNWPCALRLGPWPHFGSLRYR